MLRVNGPAFVRGPVRVIGRDVYELDRDGEGIACEPEKGKKKQSLGGQFRVPDCLFPF